MHGLHAERVGGAERSGDVAEVGEPLDDEADSVAPVVDGAADPVPARLHDVRLQHGHHLAARQLRAACGGPERVQVREPPPPSRGPGHAVAVGAALQLHEAVDPAAGRAAGEQELLDGVDAVLAVVGSGGSGGGGGERGGAWARAEDAAEEAR